MNSHLYEAGRMPTTHSGQLERWLGKEHVEYLSKSMERFYYPIPVAGVPGEVYAMPGGDFSGKIRAGFEASALDRASDWLRRKRLSLRAQQQTMVNAPRFRRQHGAFPSLSALIASATGGKSQNILFKKNGVASNAIGNAVDPWTLGNFPAAGAAGAAAPGGTAFNSASAGAIVFANPSSANTTHFVTGYAAANVINNTGLLYDRLFAVAKTMNSTANEAVTGTPTRYQNTSNSAVDFAGGNFCFPSVPTTVLPATAHNWQNCQYYDEANVASNFPTATGVSSCVKNGVDLSVSNWFIPLAAGDAGVKNLKQIACSALVATGTVDFVIGHPIAFFPCPIANILCVVDGINTAFSLTTVLDSAALAWMEMPKPATTITGYTGMITLVAE